MLRIEAVVLTDWSVGRDAQFKILSYGELMGTKLSNPAAAHPGTVNVGIVADSILEGGRV
ncbi:MAG TPA: hypothetical protein DCP32_01235 [Anaerolineaceae bacterium]|nr:MAG: hypothetical protein A2X24_11225 [Chloroflexi bacterium GWB2_54_36]HAL15407.1 hypothetical protein [Anaerolineaceae bacterium]HBA91459.1 hypothetical protein [Anaerolineaceae bacterium]